MVNVCVVRGVLSRAPEVRELRSGGLVVEYDVTVPGGADVGRPTETVPVCWFDPPEAAMRLEDGDAVVVVGRVRRRFYKGASGTMSRTEVLADRVFGPRQRKPAEKAVLDALAGAEEAFLAGSAA